MGLRFAAPFAISILSLLSAHGQTEGFEVASIHANAPGSSAGSSFELFPGGRIRMQNEPAKLLLRLAFGLQNSQIAGGPAWLDTDRFDIDAKTGQPGKLTPAQIGPLIESLLKARFHLTYHWEDREQPVYALTPAGNGPKLKPQSDGEEPGMKTDNLGGKSRLTATATPLSQLASYAGNRLGRLVIDRTGLNGGYDFTLEWSPDETPNSDAPSFATALREQLGLRVESVKAPVRVLVIDQLDRPTDN